MHFNPTALRKAKTLWSFGLSDSYDRWISVKLSCIALLFPILLKDLYFSSF